MVFRLGERHSPKRDREETWEVWVRYLTQARDFEFWAMDTLA